MHFLRNCAEGITAQKGKESLCSGLASIVGSSVVTSAQLEAGAQVTKLEELKLKKGMRLSTTLLALG